MSQGSVRHCPGCGQVLRFPEGIGGMLMACPVCGHHFISPFKLTTKAGPATVATPTVPDKPQPAPLPECPASPAPLVAPKTSCSNALAARVAALYASKAS